MHKKYGQIVIVLLLTMLVALAVGLTITQRSITDISTSTQTEQSTRALSAAEAGLEKAISQGSGFSDLNLGNQSSVKVEVLNDLPGSKQTLEYPSVEKETIAQFWLAQHSDTPPSLYYNQSQTYIYFGNSPASAVKPAVEITYVYQDASGYKLLKKFVDSDTTRPSNNGFESCTDSSPPAIPTTSSTNSSFTCKFTLTGMTALGMPVLIRVRPLYSDSQKIAVQPYDPGASCTAPFYACSLPPQASAYTSTGTAGQSQKTLKVLKTKTIPFFFDYAIFSIGDINK